MRDATGKMAESKRVDLSSLPLQASLYLHAWYVPLFVALELGCLAFKGKPARGLCRLLPELAMQ